MRSKKTTREKSISKKLISLLVVVIVLLFGGKIKNTYFTKVYSDYTSPYIYMTKMDGEEVYAERMHERTYPASLTKIMTTIVALEAIDDLSERVQIDVDTYKEMVDQGASMAGFYGREEVTYRDLLYGTILASGGETANSLAIHTAGDREHFVDLMNNKVAELGLENTHFTNPEGLDDKKQYTSAYDTAQILKYALENGHFKAIFTKEEFQTSSTLDHPDGILLESTVLKKIQPEMAGSFEIIGGKSGTTYKAGQNWATLGVVDGEEYIVVVMGAPLKNISKPDYAQVEDTLKLFESISNN